MRLGCHLFVCALLVGGRVWAAEPGPDVTGASAPDGPALPRLVLALTSALAYRDDRTADAGGEVAASGASVSHLGLEAAWFPRRSGFGGLARAELERYGLTGRTRGGSLDRRDVSAFGGRLGLGYRQSLAQDRVALVGAAGLGALRAGRAALDPTFASTFVVEPDGMVGPVIEVGTEWVGARFALGARGELWPVLWGARLAGQELSALRAGGEGYLRARLFGVGSAAAFASLSYGFFTTRAKASGLEAEQSQHRVALGLGLAWSTPAVALVSTLVADASAPAADEVAARSPWLVGTIRAGGGPGPGAPLAGVRVEASSGQVATSDAAGGFRIDGLVPGLVVLRVSAPGHQSLNEAAAIADSGETRVELALLPEGIPASAAIAGFIRDERGAPVAAEVTVRELHQRAEVDPRGRFRLEVPAGRYTLVIEAAGFQGQRKRVEVRPGEQSIYNVDLQRAP